MYDVAVVGAGPSGATAAFLAARAGLRTLLTDRRHIPREKVCGGLVTQHCATEIEQIFGKAIPDHAHVEPPVLTERVVPPSGKENGFHNPDNHIRNVDRSRFDGWLASEAVAAGAELRVTHGLRNLEQGEDGVTTHFVGPEGELAVRSRYVIGADGIYSACRRALYGEKKQRSMSILQEYYEENGVFEPSFYLLFRGDVSPTYAYVVPKDDQTMIGLGVHRGLGPPADTAFDRFRAWLRQEFGFGSRGFLRREGWSIPFGDVAFGTNRVVLVGDAGGFCEPWTGEGIYFGIESAKAAIAAVSLAEQAGTPLAEAYAPMAGPLRRKMEEITAYVLSLTDEERERRVRAKRDKLRRELPTLALP